VNPPYNVAVTTSSDGINPASLLKNGIPADQLSLQNAQSVSLASLERNPAYGYSQQWNLNVQREVWALAFPFGHEDSAGAREMTMAERAGYTCAFLNCGGGLSRRISPRFGLPRAHVTGNMDLPELDAHLSGFHDALQRRFRGGGGTLACV